MFFRLCVYRGTGTERCGLPWGDEQEKQYDFDNFLDVCDFLRQYNLKHNFHAYLVSDHGHMKNVTFKFANYYHKHSSQDFCKRLYCPYVLKPCYDCVYNKDLNNYFESILSKDRREDEED